ncbi:TolC family protein [Herbaspirillum sp. alder98]|uniref:TolC family protein n=1 Tax=Herbaspirillum sp. alder98 TaxID=2913096 RepID=UPI001CD87758|nr:TolC family protein [Herbaspirillum sp. alder98]MCA1324718.1 TolC family protein [Herbaspirillum sp. alder98]
MSHAKARRRACSRAHLLACGLALLLCGHVLAADAAHHDAPLPDLLSMLQWAEQDDPGLAGARLAYQADQAGTSRAQAAFLPQVTGSWSRERNIVKTQALPSQHHTQRRWQISLSQTLFNWDSWTAHQQSELEQAKSAIRLTQAHQALFLKVAIAYFGVLSAQEDMTHINAHQASLKQQLERTKARFARGDATLIDMRDIESAIDRQAVQATLTDGELLAKRLTLEEFSGRRLARIAPLRADMEAPMVVPDDMQRWIARARNSNFDVQLQLLDKKKALLETSRAKGAYLPTLGLTASHTPASGSAHIARTTTNAIGIQLNIPIFSGFDTVHRVRQTLALEEKAGTDLESAERSSAAAVRDTFVQLQTSRRRLQGLSDAMQSSRTALEANEIGYRIGGRSEADILQAKNAFFTVHRDLTMARYDIILQGLRLKLLTASLEFQDVIAVNGLLADAP